MKLQKKIEALALKLSEEERACLKIILANAVAETIDEKSLSEQTIEAQAYKTSVASIGRLQPHRDLIEYNGVVYRGKPSFLNDGIMRKLQAESKAMRKTAHRFHDHYVVTGAPLALEISMMVEIKRMISSLIGDVTPTGKANYIYYDEPGFGIEPHIDNEDFSLNAILMLEHQFNTEKSALVLYPLDQPQEKIYLHPGEMIVFFADSIVHARQRMKVGEKVSIVAFGFKPQI